MLLLTFAWCIDTDDRRAGAPPAYTGSVRSNRRASYQARSSKDGPGTVLNAADLGTGVDTIRPVKKVDAAGSLRLSTEYMGSLKKEGSVGSQASSRHKRSASEGGRAGAVMVDEVVLPVLQKVRDCLSPRIG